MNSHYHPVPKPTTWKDVLTEAAVTLIAFAVVYGAAYAFCWCFLIPYTYRYSLGAILTVVMLKWIVLKPRTTR